MVPRLAVALVCGAVLLGAGCSAGRSGPDPVAVSWENKVCGAIGNQFTVRALHKPDPNVADAAATQHTESSYLGDVLTGLDGAIVGVTQAGPAPVPGGDQILLQIVAALGQLKSTITTAKTQIDTVDLDTPGAFTDAFTQAGNAVAASAQKAATALRQIDSANPGLASAEGQAASCHAFDNVPIPTVPTTPGPTTPRPAVPGASSSGSPTAPHQPGPSS